MYQRIEEITELDAQRINEFVDVVQTAKFAAETGDISAAESALARSVVSHSQARPRGWYGH